ncbi:MAG TPA: flagellinolysin [Symbiobacteriaceae bacterium]|nr:flagellinolysin [Symbiobacteriaceae bacterium]
MRIQHNVSSMNAWRGLLNVAAQSETSMARLSSGNRINSAADDAAGLSISERMRSRFISYAQATRNAADGLSLVQTADATLDEVLQLLQRGRELSLQAANEIYQPDQKQSIQTEINHILAEIDRIADTAQYNDIHLFAGGMGAGTMAASVTGLRSSWLEQAEQVISTYYGITGDGTPLNVVLTRGGGAGPGWITGNVDIDGKLRDINLTFDIDVLANTPDADRIVARAMTQAVLARNSNYVSLSKWFISGASDLIAGGDDMLAEVLNNYSGAEIVNTIANPWADDSLHQASSYLALKYLKSLAAAGGAQMSDPMTFLEWGFDLNAALLFTIGMDEATFINDFLLNGEAYLDSLVVSGELSDFDVGGFNSLDSAGVIPDGGTYSLNPTANFTVNWHGIVEANTEFRLHIGTNASDSIRVVLPRIGQATLDLLGIDVLTGAADAIERFGKAISTVTSARSELGSTANMLEHTINSNREAELSLRSSYSRIHDADYARELLTLTKQQILVQSSSSVLAKANRLREHTAWLLSGLKTSGLGALSSSFPSPAPA